MIIYLFIVLFMNIYFTWSLWWYISLDSVLGSYSMISINYLSHCSAHRHSHSDCVSLWHSPSQCLSVSLTQTPTEDLPHCVSLPQTVTTTLSLSAYPGTQWTPITIRCTFGHLYILSTLLWPQHPLMYTSVRHLGNSPIYFVLSF